jgi:hypothetical protein
MRHADTDTLLRLNDQAKLNDLGQWAKVSFFEQVKPDGAHILAMAFPHGIRPKSQVQRPHLRTLWYAEMDDGTTERILIDAEENDVLALPEIEGTESSEIVMDELPPLITLEDDWVIDGHHVLAAIVQRGEPLTLTRAVFPALSDPRVEEIRAMIDDDD